MASLWTLIVLGIHGYYTVPNIPTRAECERVYFELRAKGWANTGAARDHICISHRK